MCDRSEMKFDRKHRCAGCKKWTAFRDLDACVECDHGNPKWYCKGCDKLNFERLCKKHQRKAIVEDLESSNDYLRKKNEELEKDLSETQKKLDEANAKLEAIMKLLK